LTLVETATVLQLGVVGLPVGVVAHHLHAGVVAAVTTHLARMTDVSVITTVGTAATAPAALMTGWSAYQI
jgi:hypothetical protein